jgi:hypothetical protein
MTKEELTKWALANGWQMIAGHPSLTKPSARDTAIVRLVMKTTVTSLEIKKPSGRWDKITTASYGKINADSDTGLPSGLGLVTTPGLTKLMQDNKDGLVFAKMADRPA